MIHNFLIRQSWLQHALINSPPNTKYFVHYNVRFCVVLGGNVTVKKVVACNNYSRLCMEEDLESIVTKKCKNLPH